jgi:hypothetical protein
MTMMTTTTSSSWSNWGQIRRDAHQPARFKLFQAGADCPLQRFVRCLITATHDVAPSICRAARNDARAHARRKTWFHDGSRVYASPITPHMPVRSPASGTRARTHYANAH